MAAGETLRLLDVEPDIIGRLYEYLWQIELFFRWLKCFANFDRLLSHSRFGVLLSFYVLLMYLHSSYRPSKYAYTLLSAVAHSGGDLKSVLRSCGSGKAQWRVPELRSA